MRSLLLLAILAMAACTGTTAHVDEEPEAPPAGATYAGADVCVACHDEQATSFAKTIHAQVLADESRPESDRGCEACHGPGGAHAEAGGGKGVGGLRTFVRDEPAAGRSAACLRCHAANVARHDFRRGEHALAGIACTDCHAGHGGVGDAMLRRGTPDLCFGCHEDVRAAFGLPERHGPGAAPPACLDCHEPHGSVNRHLLVRQPVALLCYQCHTDTPPTHVQPTYRDCTRCHSSIHGSNTDPHFISP